MKTIGCLAVALTAGCLAQDAKLQFEVASVRESAADPAPQAARGMVFGGPGSKDPERIIYQHVPFQRLLMDAYGVQRDQIQGPDWVNTDLLATFRTSTSPPKFRPAPPRSKSR